MPRSRAPLLRALLHSGRPRKRPCADPRDDGNGNDNANEEPAPAKPTIPKPNRARELNEAAGFSIDQETKTIRATHGAKLPLSPIMDPTFWEAKGRYQGKKERVAKPINSVERQMRVNPFALALATPPRLDNLVKVRLPRFFMQDLEMVAHPTTSEPWWVPRSLMFEEPDPSSSSPPDQEETLTSDSTPSDPSDDPSIPKIAVTSENTSISNPPAPTTTTTNPPSLKPRSPKPASAAVHLLARRSYLMSLDDPRSGFSPHALRGLISPRYQKLASRSVWRPEMHQIVLDLQRKRIVRDLRHLDAMVSQMGRPYILRCQGWGDVKFKKRGAVLWFGRDGAVAGQEEEEKERDPGLYATIELPAEGRVLHLARQQATVLVHNMALLLGEELAESLRGELSVFKKGRAADGWKERIAMLSGRRTVELQARLWKLQGYLGEGG